MLILFTFFFPQPYAPLVRSSPYPPIRADLGPEDSLAPPNFEKAASTVSASCDSLPPGIRFLVDTLPAGTSREVGSSSKRAMYDDAAYPPAKRSGLVEISRKLAGFLDRFDNGAASLVPILCCIRLSGYTTVFHGMIISVEGFTPLTDALKRQRDFWNGCTASPSLKPLIVGGLS